MFGVFRLFSDWFFFNSFFVCCLPFFVDFFEQWSIFDLFFPDFFWLFNLIVFLTLTFPFPVFLTFFDLFNKDSGLTIWKIFILLTWTAEDCLWTEHDSPGIPFVSGFPAAWWQTSQSFCGTAGHFTNWWPMMTNKNYSESRCEAHDSPTRYTN